MSATSTVSLGTDGAGRTVAFPRGARKYHLHILGAPGRGKSKFMEHLIRHDIRTRHGLCLIDPHGGLYTDVLRWCVENGMLFRRKIALIEPANEDVTFGYNPLDFQGFSPAELADAVEGMVHACTQVWGGQDMHRTPTLARILPAVFHALAVNKLTLLEALDLCDAYDPDNLRRFLTRNLTDPVFSGEWQHFNNYDPPQFTEQFLSTRNRLAAFLQSPVVRNMVALGEPSIDLSQAMEEGWIVLVNLGGAMSQESRKLLGALLVNTLFMKSLRRVPEKSRPFYLYLDEAYYFLNEDVSRILTEGRKFGLHATLAHQNLGQLREAGDAVYTAVMQIENKVVFGGIRPPDDAAEVAETIFTGEFDLEEPKRTLDKPTVVRYVREWLTSHAQAFGGGSSSGFSSGTMESTMTPHEIAGMSSTTRGGNVSAVGGSSDFYSESSSRHEALVPEIEWLPGSLYSLEEQVHRAMATMVNQPTRSAVVKLFGEPTSEVTTPKIAKGIARNERVVAFKQEAFEQADFVLPADEAAAQIAARRQRLKDAARVREQTPRDFFE